MNDCIRQIQIRLIECTTRRDIFRDVFYDIFNNRSICEIKFQYYSSYLMYVNLEIGKKKRKKKVIFLNLRKQNTGTLYI